MELHDISKLEKKAGLQDCITPQHGRQRTVEHNYMDDKEL